MFSVISLFACVLVLVAEGINTSRPEKHGMVQATVLAEGDTQVKLMRKENTSELAEDSAYEHETRSCTCSDVDLKGKKWVPGALKKCLGNCKDVKKADQPNDCPKDWKIISPTSKADWDTLTELGVFKEVAAPHVLVDVTQAANGCGGCVKKAMNSDEDGQKMWKTLDGSPWWLSDKPYTEPNGDYTANCFLGILFKEGGLLHFNDLSCIYHSHRYLCQPDQRYTTTTTEKAAEKSSAPATGAGLVVLAALAFLAQ